MCSLCGKTEQSTIEVGVLPMEAQSGSPPPPLYTNSQELTIFEASAPDKRG